MWVLHALWDDKAEKLQLWAEDSTLPLTSAKRGKRSKLRPHPFAVEAEDLRQLITKLYARSNLETATLTLPLPSQPKAPLPSPELRATSFAKASELTEWQISTLALEPAKALEFLLNLPAQPPPQITWGSALRFWVETAKLATALLVRQSFAPLLRQTPGKATVLYLAGWQAILNEADREQWQTLAKAMPPLCRSLNRTTTPSALLLSFLNATVDSFVRANLTHPIVKASRQTASVSEQWLSALTGTNNQVTAPPFELQTFSKQVDKWLGQLRPTQTAFRTCFRLATPEEGSDLWQVSFYLQANDDRSLLIGAAQVWRERSTALTFLSRQFENPQERLLADLGRASRLFPLLEKSLMTARPTSLSLTTEQAYSFLREAAPLLEQSGFGVLLPNWWQKPLAKPKIRLKLKSKDKKVGSGILGLDAILQYDWEIAIGDELLSATEFAKLAKLKQPLVRVRGQWVEIKPDEIEAAIAFFQKKQAEITLGEALQLEAGLLEAGLPVETITAEGEIQTYLDKLIGKAALTELPQPTTLKGQLRPYQQKGLAWLAFLEQLGMGACLADDMGLGKTLMLISRVLHERESHQNDANNPLKPTLLICPMSVVGNWSRELDKFAPSLRYLVHHGADRLSGIDFTEAVKTHDMVLTTYSLAQRDEALFKEVAWGRVVLDEAQNIKNPSAKQTQAIRQLPGQYRIALTGTPVENRLSELWSIMQFLNPGYLGSAADFSRRFTVPIEKYRDQDQAVKLKQLVQPFVLRRLKTDKSIIQDLPDKLEMKVYCNLTREQATLYEAIVKEMLAQIEQAEEGIQRKGLVLSTMLRLKQVCNHPAHYLNDHSKLESRSGKLARLEEMLEEVLAEGDKALIFTQFAELGGKLQTYLEERLNCEVLFLAGSTTKKQRDALVQRFQEEKQAAPLFILSLKAGGVGLNLTAANHVFHFDRWWNPAVENQATDRAFRIGQSKNVQVHKFVCIGTLEERIDQMIEQKQALAESIVGTGEGWLTELSTDQLREIFALSKEAIGE
jgi:SNF2 family DNA or RNA helicase